MKNFDSCWPLEVFLLSKNSSRRWLIVLRCLTTSKVDSFNPDGLDQVREEENTMDCGIKIKEDLKRGNMSHKVIASRW